MLGRGFPMYARLCIGIGIEMNVLTAVVQCVRGCGWQVSRKIYRAQLASHVQLWVPVNRQMYFGGFCL